MRPQTAQWYQDLVDEALPRVRRSEQYRRRRHGDEPVRVNAWVTGEEFAPWITRYVEELGSDAAASQLGITDRHLRRLIAGGVARVSVAIADRVLTRVGMGLYGSGIVVHETPRRGVPTGRRVGRPTATTATTTTRIPLG
jgi:hypothetical protein